MSRYTPIPPENFCGIPDEYSRYETSRAVIFPVPLERTTSHQQGARNGPAAILAASRNLELYDEELQLEPYKEIGIHTLAPIDTMDGGLGEVITELFTAESGLLDDNKFPVALGGEHALTPPLVSAVAQKYKDLSVLHIGAHAELSIRAIPRAPRAPCAASSRCARPCKSASVRFPRTKRARSRS
jgi:agmatinase